MPLSVALAQLNPVLGDLGGNAARLIDARVAAARQGAQLVVSSELFLSAYPPEDLLLKPGFIAAVCDAAQKLARATADGGPGILLGAPWREEGRLYNAMLLLEGGRVAARIFKCDLPTYGPFDEKRVFAAGSLPEPVAFRGYRLGVMICEDMWKPACAAHLRDRGADILIVPNGSPFESGKALRRLDAALARVKETGLPLLYLNQTGGQDELVFDGASFALDARGGTVSALPAWQEDIVLVQYDAGVLSCEMPPVAPAADETGAIYRALVAGLRDYVEKNGFPGILIGLSGGIDSALAATIAVDALGPRRVHGVMMPSPFTSRDSVEDAEATARALGCEINSVAITEAMKIFDAALRPIAGDALAGVAEENIQARCRGLMLMALSNAGGAMVLATGNKSEMAVGYATLYGDMCGGFAVLKDVYKTEVYKLARWRNAHVPASGLGPAGEVIPARVLTRAPTAELRPGQTDQDSLPPYDILDGILEGLIERDEGVAELAARGFDADTVRRVWQMLDRAEYKRRQAPPGVKITTRHLGRDRRYPITNKYRG